ncbi:TonB-dependent receptor plug domain-containing protein [Pseudoalteromonas sp. SG43-6]|uniref:TonB-dependent receptor plug domain-containing protein n=2 Tax=unclassified Pseudoalteromonas TaxID=194690 RepID=UPI0015FF9C0D|nr:TonB-dependent receptor plug domain-containing protein [Pseudoalteromonas sp. SG43-6]MBB1433864.1 TonB-dependent receptor plug domain-containing protein [Pseudoalteromonas sp. SG43-6]
MMLTAPVSSAEPSEQLEKEITKSRYETCEKKEPDCIKNIEVIEVRGQQPNPISVSSQGVYTLNRKMIEDYRFGNGNLNDLLGILPGVQYGEAAYSAEQVSNIKPSEVSISGTEGKATAYLIDGVSNNSNLNNQLGNTDRNLLQDVSGHSQELFLNLDLVESIEVYDSNIPAKYGNFNGGLVQAQTRKARDEVSLGISYRQTADDWVDYHNFYAPDFDGSDTLDNAVFQKRSFSTHIAAPLTDKLGVIAQFQYLKSQESLEQLGYLRLQEQTNYNGMVKFDYAVTTNDDISFNYLYAPYEGNYFDVNAINSDYTVKGGGSTAILTWQANRHWGYMDSQISWRSSRNSKDASSAWYNWINIPGKNWGDYDGSMTSNEGGFGDITKTQETYTAKQDFELPLGEVLFADSQLSLGYAIDHQVSVFDRLENATIYNGAIVSPMIDCAGYQIDCVETVFNQPIADIEAELGRPLDLSNGDDFLLYQSNISQTGQYFQYRQTTPKARAEASVNNFSAYVENEFEWQQYSLTLGARYDYNDFFENHNVAPRLRGSISLFENTGKFIFGANRYYASDAINYKLNEAMVPTFTEVRAIYQHRPQQWQAELSNRGYRYVYKDLKTPYSDELSAVYRHQVLGGTLELKWLYREQHESINRVKGTNELGEAILYGANSGSSEYQRLSLSWMATFDTQHVEFNVSHASNTTSAEQFDGSTQTYVNSTDYFLNFSYDDNELVYIRGDNYDLNSRENDSTYNLMTRHDMELEKQDFNRPIIANLSWGGRFDNWQLSAYARFNGEQDAIYATGTTQSIKEATSICDGCSPNRREYPVYRIEKRPSFWLLSGSVKYTLAVARDYRVTLSFEGENILNKRTYQVSPYSTGVELGRRFWLGLQLDY